MSRTSNRELVPRNGHTLAVGIVARISGGANQKEVSLDDQVDHGKAVVAELYDGPIEYRTIATKGKGERLDRPELEEIGIWSRSRELDLLVMEDVGRLVRSADAVRLWGIAVDHGTRCIAPNDDLDTAYENWEEDLISVCRDHVGHNAHTSKRLKHKLMNRFQKFGAATALLISGYLKPEGAKTYYDWKKVDEWTPTIQEALALLMAKLNCSAVAEFFNAREFPTGPYTRRKLWDGKMLRRFFANPLLKGQPGRGFRHTIKHHESGRRISVPNPKGATFLDIPHLAHVDPAEFDLVNSLLGQKNGRVRRKAVNGIDPRLRVPKKRTRFPGQFARCWYCGWHYVWGANGMVQSLMCAHSREWRCWNSIGFNGTMASEKLVQAITQQLYALNGFDAQFRQMVEDARKDSSGATAALIKELQKREQKLEQDKQKFQAAIEKYGPHDCLNEKFASIVENEKRLAIDRRSLESLKLQELQLPDSVDELRQMIHEEFQGLALDSSEFGDLMRKLVPEFFVYIVRLCDGGHILPRAKVSIDMSGIAPDFRFVPKIGDLLTLKLTIDLFEPPQRERIRQQAVRLAECGHKQREIAQLIPERPTQTAVQKALELHRKMEEMGLTSPYVLLTSPPPDYPKLRRHKNQKYRFEPMEGYSPPKLS